jgi:predicted ATPase
MAKSRKPSPFGQHLHQLELLRDRVPSFDQYPFNLPAVRHLHTLAFHAKVTFLVGENGSGKSTLLEALAVASDLNAEGGSRSFRFTTRETHSNLYRYIRLSRAPIMPNDSYFLRAESFYNVATEIDRLGVQEYYGGKSLHEQSHGEAFFAVFEQRFSGRSLYFLDEPEAALSPQRQLSFLTLLHEYCKDECQFVIATHSPIILAYPDAWIYVLSHDGIEKTAYEDTEHFKVTHSFLTRTKKMLKILLGEAGQGDAAEQT